MMKDIDDTEEKVVSNKSATTKEAEVISLLPYLKKKEISGDHQEDSEIDISNTDFSGLITLIELSTDDIAGTLIARHIYEVDLLPDIASDALLDEFRMRINAHIELLTQLKEGLKQ